MAGTVDLTLVEQFVNTLDERTFHTHGVDHVPSDRLTSVADLAAWLDEHGPEPHAGRRSAASRAGLRPADLATARRLRGALRESLAGSDAGGLADFPLRLAPAGQGRLRMVSDTGLAGLDTIVETVATSVAGGSWNRLKLCASPDCRWAFYDTSRSGGGRWCSMDACGNRHKTRAYRQRRAG